MGDNEIKKVEKEVRHKIDEATSGKRQLELLKQRYDVDEENKIISISLRYDKVSDIVLTNVGKKEYPQFDPSVFENIENLFDDFPMNYQAEIKFDIADYEGFEPNKIMTSFNDSLELTQYSARRHRKNKWLIATSMTLVGVVFLFLLAMGQINNWFGEGVNEEVISEIIDIIGCVFIWESIYFLFLEPTQQATLALKMRQKIAYVSLYKNEELLERESEKEIFENWNEEGKFKGLARGLLLCSSAAFIAIAFFTLCTVISAISDIGKFTPLGITIFVVLAVFSIIFDFFAGLSGLSKYIGKNNWLSKAVGPFAIAMTVLMIANIVIASITNTWAGLAPSISSLVINIFYVAGYFINKYLK